MRIIALSNKTGVTLVEVIIALLVLLMVFLALMQTALVSIDLNVKNVLRDEAVRIAEQRMTEAMNLTFTTATDNLVSDAAPFPGGDCPQFIAAFANGVLIEKNIRNVANFDFCTNRTVRSLLTDSKEISITVAWQWKGEEYNYRVLTVVRRQ